MCARTSVSNEDVLDKVASAKQRAKVAEATFNHGQQFRRSVFEVSCASVRIATSLVLSHSTLAANCVALVYSFLRAILSVNDEAYNRHIIHNNLFAPVFEAFRANPVGDNLVSSSIVEMCDFIHNENVMSLMEYIVTKHLSVTRSGSPIPSLEDVSSPYVSTLTTLRESYEQNLEAAKQQQQQQGQRGGSAESPQSPGGSSRYFSGKAVAPGPRVLSGKALEDQVRSYRRGRGRLVVSLV